MKHKSILFITFIVSILLCGCTSIQKDRAYANMVKKYYDLHLISCPANTRITYAELTEDEIRNVYDNWSDNDKSQAFLNTGMYLPKTVIAVQRGYDVDVFYILTSSEYHDYDYLTELPHGGLYLLNAMLYSPNKREIKL